MQLPYKLPTIVRSKNGDWFIKYFYELPNQPGVYKEFRVRDGVNYIHDLEEKEKEILKLQRDITIALEKLNFNPFNQDISVKSQIEAKEAEFEKLDASNLRWSLATGIKRFKAYCKWKKLSERTIDTYNTYLSNFNEWLTETNQLNLTASEFLESSVVKFADTYYDQETWTPRTYNNHIDFFVTLFKRLETEERKVDRNIKYHINMGDVERKTDNAEKNRAYSGIVAERVKKELALPKYKNLFQFVRFIYLSCMRPKEIRLLQIQHIDINNNQIKVIAPTGKTGDRFVPISKELDELLVELQFDKYPLNYYLFGKNGTPNADGFSKAYFSKTYLEIKTKLGLDKNYTMYGWKHTRVIDLINAGFADTDIMQLTGHRDYQSYLAYKRDLVIDSTIMKGKTIGF